MRTWTLLRERPGPVGYLTVSTRTYAMPDGHEAGWDILDGGRTVAVVALTADGDIVLTRQFRPGPGGALLELPGGGVDEDEDVLDAAARERREDPGHVPEGWLWSAGPGWPAMPRICGTRSRQRDVVLSCSNTWTVTSSVRSSRCPWRTSSSTCVAVSSRMPTSSGCASIVSGHGTSRTPPRDRLPNTPPTPPRGEPDHPEEREWSVCVSG